MSLPDLPTALRAWGLDVVEVTGWQDRRRPGTFTPMGVLVHHTAGPRGKDAPSLQVCIDGRPGLAGPLCQILIARSGKVYVIASGRANHAGAGGPLAGLIGRDEGNAMLVGIEAENDGVGEPWDPGQLDSMVSATAAVLDLLRRPRSHCWAHREWTPRKPDPTGIDMHRFRAAVATAHPPATVPPRGTMPTPTTKPPTDLTAQWQRMLLDNGADLGPSGADGGFGRLTLAASQTILDHRNLLLRTVEQVSKANATSADTIKRLTAERDDARAEVAPLNKALRRLEADALEAHDGIVRLNDEADRLQAEVSRLQALDAVARQGPAIVARIQALRAELAATEADLARIVGGGA